MKKIRLFLCLMACSYSLAGCLPDEPVSETAHNDGIKERPDEAGKAAETGKEGKDEKTDSEILDFVDAFGKKYKVEINPDIACHRYDTSRFALDGSILAYEDDSYMSRAGVDVSEYQGDIEWDKVKAAGFDFAFLRIGYRGYGETGSLNEDVKVQQNLSNARAAGLDVGVYFFAQAVDEAEAREEAEFVLNHLAGHELQLPIVYDPESILEDEARTDNVTGEQFTKNTAAFCGAVEAAGYSPMIYCNMLWEAYELDLEKLSQYPVWYADYEAKPQTPYSFEYWQYSNTGQVDGIDGNVDLNIQMIKK